MTRKKVRFLLLVQMWFTPEMICPGVHLIADQDHLYEADQGVVLWSAPESEAGLHTDPNELHQGVNTPGFGSTGLNKAGVNAP